MKLACLLTVSTILALAARSKIRDRQALKAAAVFTRGCLAGWGDGLSAATGVLAECLGGEGLEVTGAHRDAQVKAAREGRQ